MEPEIKSASLCLGSWRLQKKHLFLFLLTHAAFDRGTGISEKSGKSPDQPDLPLECMQAKQLELIAGNPQTEFVKAVYCQLCSLFVFFMQRTSQKSAGLKKQQDRRNIRYDDASLMAESEGGLKMPLTVLRRYAKLGLCQHSRHGIWSHHSREIHV